MHYSLHLIFAISLSKEKKKSQKNNFKKMLLFPFSFYHATHNFLIQKNVLIFISFPILSLLFYFPRPLRQEREGRATTEGQQTREGVPLGSRRLGTFLILFFVLSSQKSLTGFRSINRVMNLFFLLILVFYALFHSPSFAGANYWSLISLSSQNGVLKERRKMKKKKSFLKSYMKLEISNFYYHHRYYFLSSFLLDIFPSFLIFLQTAFRISFFFC